MIKLKKDEKKPLVTPEPSADESLVPPQTKGEIIFSRFWLIVCGVLLLLIIILSIIVKLIP